MLVVKMPVQSNGAAGDQDDGQADHKGRGDHGQQRKRAQQDADPGAGPRGGQGEGEPDQGRNQSDADRQAQAVPQDAPKSLIGPEGVQE